MAHIEDLIAKIQNEQLRSDLETEVRALKSRREWGLVFERHRPEMTRLLDAPIRVGYAVWERRSVKPRRFRVRAIEGDTLIVAEEGRNETAPSDAPTERIARADVLFEKQFTEFVFPALKPVESLRNGPDERAAHAVIRGENFHALRTLLASMEGQVDCLYLDPPYNTGDKTWSYDNDFVDENDAWKPSKWLAFMERRLTLARRLMKPDGIIVITIDEHEVTHLGMLLEDMFKDARIQLVTIVINGAGVTQRGLSRVDEYAYFIFLGDARPTVSLDDLLSEESRTMTTPVWFSLIRAGGVNAQPSRASGLVFPIAVDPKTMRIVGTGRTLKKRVSAGEVTGDLNKWRPDPGETLDGFPVVWPLRPDGSALSWQTSPTTVMAWSRHGFVRVKPQSDAPFPNKFSLSYVRSGNQKKVLSGEIPNNGWDKGDGPWLIGEAERRVPPKTTWHRKRHDAGKWGSRFLREFLGSVSFDYAKSPYAVLDTLRACVGDKKDAVIVDFFGGSGTTLHATLMLNAEDTGRRRCVLVTNNEVKAETTAMLNAQEIFVGDSEFEARGVYESATKPRVIAAVTGKMPNGTPVEGEYIGGRKYALGFPENVEFFRLEYLDPMAVEMGMAFKQVSPLLWLAAGGIGKIEGLDTTQQFALSNSSPYAVVFEPAGVPGLLDALQSRPDVIRVFVVAASDSTFSEIASMLPEKVQVVHLYRTMLETLRGAVA